MYAVSEQSWAQLRHTKVSLSDFNVSERKPESWGCNVINISKTHCCSLIEIERFEKTDHSRRQPFCVLRQSLESLPLIACLVIDILSFNPASVSRLLHHLHWQQHCTETGEKGAPFFKPSFPSSDSRSRQGCIYFLFHRLWTLQTIQPDVDFRQHC